MRTLTSLRSFERGLGAVLVANLFDASLTALWVGAGIVEEGNPIMAWAIEHGWDAFILSKVLLVGLGAALLYRLRDRRMARVALVPAVVLYGFVLGGHLGIAVQVGGHLLA